MNNLTITPLDLAWEAINALGGVPTSSVPADIAYDAAIGAALAEIEKLGGSDPAHRRWLAANKVVQIGDHDKDYSGTVDAVRREMAVL